MYTLKGGFSMSKRNILVCVTQQKTCERLIMNGYSMLEDERDKLYVIHVVNEKDSFFKDWTDADALEYLFGVSKKVGADLTVLRSKDIVETISEFAKKNKITHILMGVSQNQDITDNQNITFKLKKTLPKIKFYIL
jgi:K+-sensing histidine kinase KdpD